MVGEFFALVPGEGPSQVFGQGADVGGDAFSDMGGGVTQRLSYDPWGRRRNTDGSASTNCTITSPTTRADLR